MPLYTTASTAVALVVSEKWLDNLLSRNKIDGVQQARQGVSRRLSLDAVATIAVAKALMDGVSSPASAAIPAAQALLESGVRQSELGHFVSFHVDRDMLLPALVERLANAVEVTPVPARGRPPRR